MAGIVCGAGNMPTPNTAPVLAAPILGCLPVSFSACCASLSVCLLAPPTSALLRLPCLSCFRAAWGGRPSSNQATGVGVRTRLASWRGGLTGVAPNSMYLALCAPLSVTQLAAPPTCGDAAGVHMQLLSHFHGERRLLPPPLPALLLPVPLHGRRWTRLLL